jgi:signal transduction histidine kinase
MAFSRLLGVRDLKQIQRNKLNYRFWSAISLVLFALCISLFYYLYSVEKNKTIDELNARQLVHAKQAAKGLENYVDSWIKQLIILSRNESIIKLTPQGKKFIDTFYEEQKEQIKSIARVDLKGKIIYAPKYLSLTGKNIVLEKHISEILTSKKVIVSDVFSAVQGYNAMAIHVPVYDGTKFIGTLGAIIQVENAAKRFLEDIVIGESGYAWMISKDGTELYCPVPGHVGISVNETCKDFPSILRMAKEMMAGKTGNTTYIFNRIRNKKVEIVKKYAVYVPVHVHNTFWSIVVASSEDEVLNSLISYRNKLFLIIITFFITGTIFAYYGMKTWGIIKESNARQKAELQLQGMNAELEQKVIERTKQLEKINRDLESFNYTVSHDLRAPIRAINGFAQILSEEYTDKLDSEAQNIISRIKKAVLKMDLLIASLLKLSRLNYYSLDLSEINISLLARSIAKEIQNNYPEAKYDVKIQDNMYENGDHGLVASLLENLLDNAFKFSSKTQKPVIEFFMQHKEGKNIFCLRDNGAGFDSTTSDKLFTPFKRFHNESEFTGIGIGLAIVKKIIDRHNGTFGVDSQTGIGSSFYFTLN